MKKALCAHCDHYVRGYSNGLGSAGSDTFRCCHCGRELERKWRAGRDPAHGVHVELNIKVYEE